VVSGIGNPESFMETILKLGLEVNKTVIFQDHHQYNANDLCSIMSLEVVMTEKDAVKCREFAFKNCWYLKVEMVMEQSFLQLLKKRISSPI